MILQIIGIVLGVIGIIIVFAICTPVTYRAEGSFHRNKPEGHLRSGWLLNIVRIFADFKKGKGRVQVKVLFFTVFDSSKKKKAKKRKRKKARRPAAPASSSKQEELFEIEEEHTEEAHEEKDKGILAKIRAFFSKIHDGIQSLKEKVGPYLVWLDPEHRRLIAFLWTNGLKILKKVKPKSFSLKGSGGTGDPYTTGMILSWTGLAVGMLGIPGVEFEPDYENKKLDIDAQAGGYFFVLPVALIALKIYRNKDFQRFILKKNNPTEEKNHG